MPSRTGGLAGTDSVAWLLSSAEPGIRLRTRRDLLGDQVADQEFAAGLDGPNAQRLLDTLGAEGALGDGWQGPQWRLLALFDLGAPGDDARMEAGAEWVVDQAMRRSHHHGHPTVIDSLHRFNVEGNALSVGLRSGMDPRDPRIQQLAGALIEGQWPDGGWNCHRNARRRSTFHESLSAARGLHQYAHATGDRDVQSAVWRTAELFLEHRLIYSLGSGTPSRRQPDPPPAGAVINPRWELHRVRPAAVAYSGG